MLDRNEPSTLVAPTQCTPILAGGIGRFVKLWMKI